MPYRSAAAAILCALAVSPMAACGNLPAIGRVEAAPTTLIAKAQSIARTTCAILPTAESLAALFAASPEIATAEQIADIACRALTAGSAFASGRKPTPPPRPRKGERVEGTAIVNGKPVAVTGTRTR